MAKRHRPGEQRADDWWRDAAAAIRNLDVGDAAGVSLSGRAGAGVFLDAAGEVLAEPWADGRHGAHLARLRDWRAEHGNELSNYGAALVAKYLWLKAEQPGVASKCRRACYAKDFLLYRLTGAHATDWSSGPDSAQWDAGLSGTWGLPEGLLPRPALPWQLAGGLTEAAARQTGLKMGTPVAVGAHDGVCANVGAGAIGPGDFAVTLGTHAVTRTIAGRVAPGARRFYAMPPHGHVIGGNALFGGRALDWVLDLAVRGAVGAPGEAAASYREAESLAAAAPAGANGVTFLPFLGGQLAPEHRPDASAAFAGLRLDHGPGALVRATMEGVAFALADIVEQVAGWCGPPKSVRLTGGGAASPLWRNILASVLDRSLRVSDAAVEGRGAAVFLAVALGVYPDYQSAVGAMVPPGQVVEPTPGMANTYQALRNRWQAVRDTMRALDGSREAP